MIALIGFIAILAFVGFIFLIAWAVCGDSVNDNDEDWFEDQAL